MHEKIVEILSQTEEYISGQELSAELGVSRQAVWKAINALKVQGYVIDSITRKATDKRKTRQAPASMSVRSNWKSGIIP